MATTKITRVWDDGRDRSYAASDNRNPRVGSGLQSRYNFVVIRHTYHQFEYIILCITSLIFYVVDLQARIKERGV